MSKASTELLEQGTQTPSPAPDLIPAETKINRELTLRLVQQTGALQFRATYALQQADASVPSQNRVIVTLGANAQSLWRPSLIYRVELKPRTVLLGVIGVIAFTHLIA